MVKRIGYVRLSRDDSRSMSVESQRAALLDYDPSMTIFEDVGVSGATNLTDPKSAWSTGVRPAFQANPTNTEIVIWTHDRIGRRKGKVLSELEDIFDSGGSLYVVREGRTFNDSEDVAQSIELTFRSYGDEAYRVEIKKKTKRSLDILKENQIPLGRKPALYEKQIAEIMKLSERGLGLTAIGKAVRTTRKKDGASVVISPRVIRKVLAGEYESREAYERRELQRRQEMAARSVLGSRLEVRDA